MKKGTKKFNTTDYVQYELDFIALCKKLKLKLRKDEDGAPIIRPRSKKNAQLYKMCCWGVNKGDVTITCHHGKQLARIIGKIRDSGVKYHEELLGDTEAIVTFKLEDIMIVAKALRLTKKKSAGKIENLKNIKRSV